MQIDCNSPEWQPPSSSGMRGWRRTTTRSLRKRRCKLIVIHQRQQLPIANHRTRRLSLDSWKTNATTDTGFPPPPSSPPSPPPSSSSSLLPSSPLSPPSSPPSSSSPPHHHHHHHKYLTDMTFFHNADALREVDYFDAVDQDHK